MSCSITWIFFRPTATWLATARPSSTRALPSATRRPISSPFATSGTASRELRPPRASSARAPPAPACRVRFRARDGSRGARAPRSRGRAGRRGTRWRRAAGAPPRRRSASSSSSASARAIASASSVSCSSSATRSRASSYIRAFSIALATSDAEVTRKSTSSSENSRGASVWAVMTPITSPERPMTGSASSDWNFSSSSSGKYFVRGSASAFSRMKAGSPRSAAHHASPSPRSIATLPACFSYGGDAARSTSRSPPSRRYAKQAWTPLASDMSFTTERRTSVSSSEEATVETICWSVFSPVCSRIRRRRSYDSLVHGVQQHALASQPCPCATACSARSKRSSTAGSPISAGRDNRAFSVLLLSRANEAVPAGRLIDELWADDPTRDRGQPRPGLRRRTSAALGRDAIETPRRGLSRSRRPLRARPPALPAAGACR